jgi:hypothetical protein
MIRFLALVVLTATASTASAQTKVTILWGDTIGFGAEGALGPLNDPFTEVALPTRAGFLDTQITEFDGFYDIAPYRTHGADYSNNFFGNISLTSGVAYVSSRLGEGADRVVVNLSAPSTDCEPDGFWDWQIWGSSVRRDGVTFNSFRDRQLNVQAQLVALFSGPGDYVIDTIGFSCFNQGDWGATSPNLAADNAREMSALLAFTAAALPNVTAPLVKTVAIRRHDVGALLLPSPGFNNLACNAWTGYEADFRPLNQYVSADGVNLDSFGLWRAGVALGRALYL